MFKIQQRAGGGTPAGKGGLANREIDERTNTPPIAKQMIKRINLAKIIIQLLVYYYHQTQL